jgi:uncharacterized membrane protein YwzB
MSTDGPITDESNDYCVTRYWALKSNDYFAIRYWALKNVTISSFFDKTNR